MAEATMLVFQQPVEAAWLLVVPNLVHRKGKNK
jgi:hypothetical protein